ncbi:unnamed protein product, partial [marine sediment metagenome]
NRFLDSLGGYEYVEDKSTEDESAEDESAEGKQNNNNNQEVYG